MILHRSRLRLGKMKQAANNDSETKLLRIYSKWQETRDVTLQKKLFLQLETLARRMPHYDARRPFQNAF